MNNKYKTLLSLFILMVFLIFLFISCVPSDIEVEYEPVKEAEESYDGTLPAEIEEGFIKTFHTPGEARDIIVKGDYAYVADGEDGLQIIDITKIEDCYIIGNFDTDGKASSICLQNDFIYIANWENGIQIIDVSDKENPCISGGYNVSGIRFTSISVEEEYAYVAYSKYNEDDKFLESGIEIIDTRNKKAPLRAATYGIKGRANKVIAGGNYLFVTYNDYDKDYKLLEAGILVIDIRNPIRPVIVGKCNTGSATFNLFVQDNYAYIASENGLDIVDITSKNTPAVIGKFQSYAAVDVFIEDDFAYIIYFPPTGSDENIIKIVDVSNKEKPDSVKNLFYPIGNNSNIFIEDDYLYITDGDIQVLRK